MKKPPSVGSAASPDRVSTGGDGREDAAKKLRSKAESRKLNRPPVALAERRKLLAVRERETNRQLADAAHQCAERLRCVTAHLDRQIDELDLPAQQHSLATNGAGEQPRDDPAPAARPERERYVRWRDLKPAIQGRESEIVDALGIIWRTRATHARCPLGDHADNNPSFRWDEKDSRYYCSCGSGSALDLITKVEKIDFEQAKIRAAELLERRDLIVDPNVEKRKAQGLTIEQLGEAKRLPVAWLRLKGLHQGSYGQVPAVRIPFINEHGVQQTVQFRVALTGDKNQLLKKGHNRLPLWRSPGRPSAGRRLRYNLRRSQRHADPMAPRLRCGWPSGRRQLERDARRAPL
jgi:hypothetical protein